MKHNFSPGNSSLITDTVRFTFVNALVPHQNSFVLIPDFSVIRQKHVIGTRAKLTLISYNKALKLEKLESEELYCTFIESTKIVQTTYN